MELDSQQYVTVEEAGEGTVVTLQETNTLEFHDGYVDEDGFVRYEKNGALFSSGAYEIVEVNDDA